MKVPFDADLIRNLKFEERPVSITADGALVSEKTPGHIRDWVLRDSVLPGFGVRVSRGAKSFFVQRKRGGSTSDRFTLTQQHSLTAARKQAQKWLGKMAEHADPRDERTANRRALELAKNRRATTFGVVLEGYENGGVGLRDSTKKDRRMAVRWMRNEPLWKVPMYSLSKDDVHRTFGTMMEDAQRTFEERGGGPGKARGLGPHGDIASAWKAMRHCAAAWTASGVEKAAANPFDEWRRANLKTLPRVGRRQTVLPHHEKEGLKWLKALWALGTNADHTLAVVRDYILCLLIWGGRREEVRCLRWSEIDEHEGTVLFRGAVTKTRRDVWVPLTPWARDILRQRKELNRKKGFGVDQLDWIFPSKNGKGAVVEVRKVQQLLFDQSGLWIGPHDLRRTLAADIFGDTKNVHSVGMALGHAASEQNVSAGYVPLAERLRTLRPLYEARERRLKQLIGIEKKTASLSAKQKAIFEAAELMLRNAGISLDEAANRWSS